MWKNMLVSSANKIKFTSFYTLTISLIYSKKNKGPSIEPLGRNVEKYFCLF